MGDYLESMKAALDELEAECEKAKFEALLDGEVRDCAVCGKLLADDEGIDFAASGDNVVCGPAYETVFLSWFD